MRANQLDVRVLPGANSVSIGISRDVSEITSVPHGSLGGAVGGSGRVEMRAGRDTAIGIVAELVDVEAALGIGVVAGDVPRDEGRGVLRGLLEGDGALDVGVTTENSDCERN